MCLVIFGACSDDAILGSRRWKPHRGEMALAGEAPFLAETLLNGLIWRSHKSQEPRSGPGEWSGKGERGERESLVRRVLEFGDRVVSHGAMNIHEPMVDY